MEALTTGLTTPQIIFILIGIVALFLVSKLLLPILQYSITHAIEKKEKSVEDVDSLERKQIIDKLDAMQLSQQTMRDEIKNDISAVRSDIKENSIRNEKAHAILRKEIRFIERRQIALESTHLAIHGTSAPLPKLCSGEQPEELDDDETSEIIE